MKSCCTLYVKHGDLVLHTNKVITVEVRVCCANVKKIGAGTVIHYRTTSNNRECFRRVVAVRRYSSFAQLVEAEEPEHIHPAKTRPEILTSLRTIYPNGQEKAGVYAIQLEI